MLQSLLTLLFLLLSEILPGSLSIDELEQLLLSSPPPVLGAKSEVTVARVIDGDTIKLNTGETVRYIGIDTPETKDPRQTVQCFGQAAAERNRQLVEGKVVELQKDVSETDRYGRLLRYVYQDGVLINHVLVEEGYARAASYPPDIAFQAEFTAAQQAAQNANRGLWGACD